jgi:7-cyano-7-deazaguanine synthase
MNEPVTKEKLVLLYSGGLDSTLLLYLARDLRYDAHCLLVDYGQKHRRELETAAKICDTMGVPRKYMSVDLMGVPSALTGSNVHALYQGVSEWHVPGRNTIFLGLALSYAESIGAKKIWFGPNFADRLANFPDCSQEYVHAMNKAFQFAASYPVDLEAPLLGMRKETIRAIAASMGIREGDTHSGYAA